MTTLPGGMVVCAGIENECQRFVVCDHMKGSTFKEVSEMLDRQVNG